MNSMFLFDMNVCVYIYIYRILDVVIGHLCVVKATGLNVSSS